MKFGLKSHVKVDDLVGMLIVKRLEERIRIASDMIDHCLHRVRPWRYHRRLEEKDDVCVGEG